ncbi:hypothetical protein MASR2M78_04160 [Treponema sp.]
MSISQLVSVSQRYGKNPEYVVAGGGNTSFKDEKVLYVKGSGTALADITEDGFVRMDREALAAVWTKTYPEDSEQRESAILTDLMAARLAGQDNKRPSVETLLHDILPYAFVVHTHPALVNGLSCSKQGEKAMQELFASDALWIPATNPGYILSKKVKDAMAAFKAKNGKEAAIIFLQNHGIFIGADTIDGIDTLYKKVMTTLSARIKREPDFSSPVSSFAHSQSVVSELESLAKGQFGSDTYCFFSRDKEIAGIVKDRASFQRLASSYTPDHIVYAGSVPLFVEEDLTTEWAAFLSRYGRAPKTVAVKGLGIFGLGSGEKAARLAVELFKDAVKVAVYTEAFGGPSFMTQDQIDFINNWEVERYRSRISTKETT